MPRREIAASVQHELRPGLTATVEYNRRWYGNQTVTNNRARTISDWTPYCVTAPVDSRLPNGGGYQVCDGLFDLNPSVFGRNDNIVTFAKNFGDGFSEQYNGIDFNMRARLPGGLQLNAGTSFWSTGLAFKKRMGCWRSIIGRMNKMALCPTIQP